MKIKYTVFLLLTLFLFIACKNEEKQNDQVHPRELEENYEDDESVSGEEITSDSNEKSAADYPRTDEEGKKLDIESKAASQPSELSEGKYIREGEEDGDCNCYCLELTFTGTTELCLKEEAIFITTRMSRGEDGMVNIYFVEPAARNSEGKDIPWNDFDTNTPIANISTSENGKMQLDWLGFTINGDLAMDYAIYGKKTLEGLYKKK